MFAKSSLKIFISVFFLQVLLLALFNLSSCTNENVNKKEFTNVLDFNKEGVDIGLQTGSSLASKADKIWPKANIRFLSGNADLLSAINSGKIDAIFHEEMNAKYLVESNKNLSIIEDNENVLGVSEYAFCFQKTKKGEELRNEFNNFLDEFKSSGEYEKLLDYWTDVNLPEDAKVEYEPLPNKNGEITFYVEGQYRPFAFVHFTKLVGLDIALAKEFCESRGYALNVVSTKFESLIPSLQFGKCDIVGDGITITEERAESILFSNPTVRGKNILIVNRNSQSENVNFIDKIKESFYKTFIKENRYVLFLRGIRTTLLITIISIILGSALGFIFYLLYYNGNKFVGNVFLFLTYIFKRLPLVVFLMLLFFVVFGKVDLDGVVIAIIGFSIKFMSSIFDIIKHGVKTIDYGQTEAAYALGYNKLKTFFEIILPQVLPKALTTFKGEILGLITSTSVVGYVMVNDLTKVGDIVRSRTYEAFFPLIIVAIIYIILAEILVTIVNTIEKFVSTNIENTHNKLMRFDTNDRV